MPLGEFDLIQKYFTRPTPQAVLGIGDDCALLLPPPGMQLAVTMDALNVGVHFPPDTAPADIGWKALAVNLSDLAAMGAAPAWCTLSLSLPQPDAAWIDGFLDGFLDLAGEHGIALVGGDTTRGPLSISVTAMGLVEPGGALRRDGARVGDDVWVTGTLGDAAGGLALLACGTLAAALAHEFAHNLLGHRAWLREAGRKRANIRLTEREADRLMPWLLANAGYDPQAAVAFMTRWGSTHDAGLRMRRHHEGWDERAEAMAAEVPLVQSMMAGEGKADWATHFRREIDPAGGLARASGR